VRGDLGGRDSWQCEYATFCSGSALGDKAPVHHEQRWEAVTQLQTGGYGGRSGSFHSIALSCATFDAGQKVKGSLNGAEVARLCICICICQPASQLSRSTTPIAGSHETGQAALWPVLNAAAPAQKLVDQGGRENVRATKASSPPHRRSHHCADELPCPIVTPCFPFQQAGIFRVSRAADYI
jgi:hypothetical protein